MSSCSDYPTAQTAKTFKLDAETTNEVVTLQQDRTNPASDGKTKKTMWGIENDATVQRENIENLAEAQRQNIETTFTAQFAYKRIGNISAYVGDTLQEADKLNSYQYPDDSGEWYGPVQSQVFPITIPADPSSSSDWALVNALTSDSLELYTDIAFRPDAVNSAVEVMLSKFNANPLMHAVGTYIKTGGSNFKYVDSTGPITIDNFRVFSAYHIDDFKKPTDVDETSAIQSVFDLGGSIEFAPLKTYSVSETITVKKDMTQVNFNGAEIKNSTNDKLIFQFGDPNAVNGYARNCCIENFKITGNAASLGGIKLWSSAAVNDATGVEWNDSSKKNVIKNFEVNEIQSGASLTVYSWANSFYDFTVYREPGMLASKNGLILAYECNSNTFCNTYITGTDEEGIKTETGALTGAVVANNFTGSTTVQYCGGPTFANIDIDRTWNTTFDVVYGEIHADSTAPFIKVGGASIDVKFKNIYLLVNTTNDVPALFDTEGRNTVFGGVYLNANSDKTVVDIFKQGTSSTASMRLEDLTIKDNITYTNIINSSRPYVWMDEDKIDIFSNDATGGNRLNLVSPRPTIRIEDSVNNDSKKEFIDGGRWRVITRDESSGVDSDFINYDYTRPVSFTNGFGDPEGLVTANPGSWHSSTSGAMYVKVTGTGNTGWKKIQTEA